MNQSLSSLHLNNNSSKITQTIQKQPTPPTPSLLHGKKSSQENRAVMVFLSFNFVSLVSTLQMLLRGATPLQVCAI